jgi:hypothetical protein
VITFNSIEKESLDTMNTFNKKSLCVALAAAGMVGAAGVAQAVNVSGDGLGQVLIYPYYTVNKDFHGNAFNTLMSVVNTTASTKAVKVRFREGRNSVEVLDFNVFLSPWDVWTAAITPTSAGGGHIATSDKSCTIPAFPAGGVDFRTLGLESGDDAVTRTAEGYIEVFEMATYTDTSVVAVNSKHSGGVPKDCSKVTDTAAGVGAEQGSPQGGLFGSLYVLSPYGGAMFSQPAVALDNFSDTPAYYTTGSTSPTYADASPAVSNTIVGGNLYQSDWGSDGFNAVTAVLMTNAVTNEYVLETGTKSQSTWIITFPTKFNYVNGSSAPLAPFTGKYVSKTGACENFYGVIFDREESSPQVVVGTDFSPQPGPGAGPTMCWEAQNISFGPAGNGAASSNIFGSANNGTVTTPYKTGWATLGFNSASNPTEHTLPNSSTQVVNLASGGTTSGVPTTYYGLPVVGFGAQTFENEALAVGGKFYLSTFGASFPHHPSKKVEWFLP